MHTLSMKTDTADSLPKDHIDEVGSAYRIKNNIWKEISFAFWNSRSYDYVKMSFLNARTEDIIMLTETQDHEVNIFGYKTVRNKRKKNRGGGSTLTYEEILK